MRTLNSSHDSGQQNQDISDAIYASQGTPDVHQYWKLTPARWTACISAVLVIHTALIAFLWFAGAFELVRVDQDLSITLSDAGGQSSAIFIMEATPGLLIHDSAPEALPKRIADSIPAPIAQMDPAPEDRRPEPPSIVMKTKPVQVTQPNKKQPTPEKASSQTNIAAQDTQAEKNKSTQNRAYVPPTEELSISNQSAPKLVKSPKPRYPSESIRRRQEGRVVVSLEVLESGAVGEVTIAQSSGFAALDQSALESLKNWHYANASGNGQMVRQWVRVSIVFELKNR